MIHEVLSLSSFSAASFRQFMKSYGVVFFVRQDSYFPFPYPQKLKPATWNSLWKL